MEYRAEHILFVTNALVSRRWFVPNAIGDDSPVSHRNPNMGEEMLWGK